MDLTTPDKNQSSTSVAQFEDSPVFNYINNLSPIVLAKSRNIEPPLNSLAFGSPPTVFASPQLNSHRETTRFIIKRLQSSDLSKTEFTKRKDDDAISKNAAEGSKLSDLCAETCGSSHPSGEELELAIELPQGLKCDCDSPDGNVVPRVATGSTDSVVAVAKNENERCVAYMCEKDLRKISALGQVEDGGEGDWVNMLSDASNILTYDSSAIEGDFEEQKMADPGTISFISNVLEIPQDNTGNLENLETIACVDSCNAIEESVEYEEEKEDKVLLTFSGTLLNKEIVSEATQKADLRAEKCCQSGCKNKIRRRCLVFEMTGAHKRKPACDSSGGFSVSSQSDSEAANMENYSTPGKTIKNSTLCMLPERGFGLHLNSLATMINDSNSVKIDTGTPGDKQPMLDLVPPVKKDGIIENAAETPTGVAEDYGISSPKTKRPKIEHAGASCKRCNCKRSKCLKLYCECFAAGLYCIEPCSCQDCFNKPAHEDTVLETRKQIESRNPLAFAPKVITSAESFSEFGDENKTPASARHKRGCNCKKSSCLKKYCECFQGGVGCSSGCRCEGCKNTFGTKIGVEINEGRESEACDRDASDTTLKHEMVKYGVDNDPDHPIHSDNARLSIQPVITFGRHFSGTSHSAVGSIQIVSGQKLRADILCRQSKFETHLQAIPEDETPEILTSKCSPTNGVKSTSPNSKRVSPPHQEPASSNPWKNSRKLILRSVPPFPSLSSPSQQ